MWPKNNRVTSSYTDQVESLENSEKSEVTTLLDDDTVPVDDRDFPPKKQSFPVEKTDKLENCGQEMPLPMYVQKPPENHQGAFAL